MKKINDSIIPDPNCWICNGEGWVCENHKLIRWDGGNASCCGNKPGDCGAGMPCQCTKTNGSEIS